MIAALKALYARQEQKLEEMPGQRGKRRPQRRAEQVDGPPQAPAALDPCPEDSPAPAQPKDDPPAASAAVACPPATPKVNDLCVSSTDPDAAIASHAPNCKSGSRPRYMSHRAVDDPEGVITAVISTPGDVNEGMLLGRLIEQHEANSGLLVETAVADSKYGTIDNYLECDRLHIKPHMADLEKKHAAGERRGGIFPDSRFVYDLLTNTYRCPAGQILHVARHHVKRNSIDYAPARGTCAACPLRQQCTRSKTGRSIKRHDQQQIIDAARKESVSPAAKRDRCRRKHLMEGSFADASNNHGLKRSRWRRLWRQTIQDGMIAAVQNMRILMRRRTRCAPAAPESRSAPCRLQGRRYRVPQRRLVKRIRRRVQPSRRVLRR